MANDANTSSRHRAANVDDIRLRYESVHMCTEHVATFCQQLSAMGRCADVAVAEFAGLRQRWHGFYALLEFGVVYAFCDIRAVLDVAAVVEMVRGRWIPDGVQSFVVHVCVYERADPVSGKAFGGKVFWITIVVNIIFAVACCMLQPVANALVYIVINLAGMYTKYMTDRGQRLAFIETHKAMEHKRESEKEYDRTQKLLDSSE